LDAQVRGAVLLGVGTAVPKLWGPVAWQGVLDKLEPALREKLTRGEIVTSGWYPAPWFAALHDAVAAQCGPGSASKLGRQTSIQDVNTLFKFVLKLMSPEMVIAQAPRLWSTMYKGITLVEDTREKGRVAARIGPLINGNAHVWEDWLESLATFLELAGAKNVQKKVLSGGGAKDVQLAFELRWDS
jgi:hypothetical protein